MRLARPKFRDYVTAMRTLLGKALVVAIAGVLVFGIADASAAKKKRAKSAPVPDITRDAESKPSRPTYGIPDIMREERPSRRRAEPPAQPKPRADRPVRVPRGSSTYIMPPVPSPNGANSPPPAVLLQMPPPPNYPPPSRNSFGDRVITCIHSAPLNTGIGNNPPNAQAYVRQCAN